jgi:hypothetical protein
MVVDVETQDLAELVVGEILRVADPLRMARAEVVAASSVAGRDVEVAVGSEADPAAVVVRLRLGDREQPRRRGVRDAAVARDLVALDADRPGGVDVVNEELAVVRVVGMEGEAEQSLLRAGGHVDGGQSERSGRSPGRGS